MGSLVGISWALGAVESCRRTGGRSGMLHPCTRIHRTKQALESIKTNEDLKIIL